jgi:proline dehydrogenase
MLNKTIVKLVPFLPQQLVLKLARRYIAGETMAEGLALAQRLRRNGYAATLDILGEDTMTRTQASDAASDYIHLIESMRELELSRNVSLKLTALGLRLSPDVALENLKRVLEAAARTDVFVRIDMEDASLSDPTLDLYARAREIWPRVGTVLQSRLKRTVADAARMRDANIRLCKGAYKESPRISFERQRAIRRSYMEAFRRLIDGGSFVGVATHDAKLIRRVRRHVTLLGIPKDRLEFQSLLGVPIRSLLEELKREGYKVRLYVPFGASSLSYSIRRLEENPGLAFAIVKSIFKQDRIDAANLL